MTTTPTAPRSFRERLDGFFEISKRGSTVGGEVRGGLVTFVAMAYIVILNPIILSGSADVTGGELGFAQVAAVTALTAGVMTILFGLVARLPFAFAAGLGINSFLAVSVVGQVTWAEAMGLVVINGLIIVLLAATGLRAMIFNAVPIQLKIAITVGIGLFIAFIGFVDAGFVRSTGAGSPPVGLGIEGSVATVPTAVFVISLLLTGVLVARKIKGALLIGIVASTIIAIIAEAVFKVGASNGGENPGGWNLSVPTLPTQVVGVPDLSLLGQVSFGGFERIGVLAALMLVFTLVFTNFFDAMGTMTGLSKEAGVADAKGDFPRLRSALIVEGVGAVAGGATSSSSSTVFIESGAGIGEGARTGLANLVTGALFLLAMFFTPLTQIVPSEVAAAALVIVGTLMMSQIKDIVWTEFSVALPVFLTVVVMPLTYSIANGIGAGFIAWVVLRSLSGKAREISPLLWVVAAGFLVFFARGPIEQLLGVAS
ncbi:NCS2 family permease [Plantibacter sp. VKM Ac-2885]|uniref:NCS2 family permease n=1 Tax=Plantibacter TaxID=190323 RepID=UPI0010C214DE|nr:MULTISPECIES: NCS2 family permease [Plantibacter]MBD8103341.1 NCS2 family permease [Plantibacter sp. CFBP 8775]MBD8468196.1 NCS2 family permease [Plantibacter sp. CFBP 8798]MBD8516804.1 NCS2 family permease [Plantibacter sp. CFBP 8804]MBF4514605.1 NCS2 family permease [Plantibacter sp. VKM Ac-2885]MBF4566768.1 NCS2 family permease [Plantibacter sp. VKM Ac-2876]